MTIIEVLGVYFLLGIVALVLLDLITKRVRGRLKAASQETQLKLLDSGSFISPKTAVLLTLGALWLFYPVAIYAALFHKGREL